LKLSRELGKHNGEAPQQKEEAHFKIKVLKTENYETGIMAAIIYTQFKICKDVVNN